MPLLPQWRRAGAVLRWRRQCEFHFAGEGLDSRRRSTGRRRCAWVCDISKLPRSCCCRSRSRPARATTIGKSISYTDDRGGANQPFPNNYRPELLAFLKTYLNNPVGVHDAVMAEPVQRTVGGRLRYVSCLRFSARDSDGNYRDARDTRWSMSMAGSTVSSRSRRALRRCDLCGVSGAGKADALTRSARQITPKFRSLFSEP